MLRTERRGETDVAACRERVERMGEMMRDGSGCASSATACHEARAQCGLSKQAVDTEFHNRSSRKLRSHSYLPLWEVEKRPSRFSGGVYCQRTDPTRNHASRAAPA